MPKDLLTITVNTTDPEAAAPFNLTVQSSVNVARSTSLTQQPTLQQYLVSNEGTIDFPVLGSLQVSGLTKSEAENLIRQKLGAYLKETPIVTVRMTNYKISVLGEVARPGMFTINNEKVNIFEALALAGDLTIWGMRDNVKLIRENAIGQREIINLNLNSVFRLSKLFGAKMKERNYGRIINLASIAGICGLPERCAYSVAKAGVLMLTKTMAMELSKSGVTVNSVSPGMIKDTATPSNGTWLGYTGTGEDVSRAIIFLAADESGYITGTDLPVDGGRILGPLNPSFKA
jgi:polysaccharide export outer membrane protein